MCRFTVAVTLQYKPGLRAPIEIMFIVAVFTVKVLSDEMHEMTLDV